MDADVYPQEVLADEEPKYLRRQKPLEIKRRKFGRKAWMTYLRVSLWILAALALAGMAYVAENFLFHAPAMALLKPDQVHIAGNRYVQAASVLGIFAADRNHSVLRIPLDQRRKQIESLPWVEQAAVRRALPNRIEVEITERTPIAFLRDGSEMSLVDAYGMILERPLKGRFSFSGGERRQLRDANRRARKTHGTLCRIHPADSDRASGCYGTGERSGSVRC